MLDKHLSSEAFKHNERAPVPARGVSELVNPRRELLGEG
jgi:hypothetical protein